MGTIIELVRRAGSVLTSLPVFRNSSFETYLSYDRNQGRERVEFVIVHPFHAAGDNFQPPFLALTSRNIKRNPNDTPGALLNLSMEEARLLRDYLNRPEVLAWLEED